MVKMPIRKKVMKIIAERTIRRKLEIYMVRIWRKRDGIQKNEEIVGPSITMTAVVSVHNRTSVIYVRNSLRGE